MNNKQGMLVFILLIVSLSAHSADFTKAWFKPSLEVIKASVCEDIWPQGEDGAVRVFSQNSLPPRFTSENIHNLDQVTIDDETIYLHLKSKRWCGGLCQSHQVLASTKPFPGRKDNYDFYKALSAESPPSSPNMYFLSSNENMYYVLIKEKESEQLHQLTKGAEWEHVCTAAKKPSENHIARINNDYTSIQASLKELRGFVEGVRRGAGPFCGSLKSHWRRGVSVNEAFEKLLYFPTEPPKKQDRYARTYEESFTYMQQWGLQGLGEYESLRQFTDQMPKTLGALSHFYQKHFHWDKAEADIIADYSLKNAINAGFGFSSSDNIVPKKEVALRQAILDKRPLEEIKAIDLSTIDKAKKPNRWEASNESVLNIAVNSPEVLAYLLAEGFDPNTKNVFYKTSLMYAVQHNNYESAKLLIDAGAKLNESTVIPDDKCRFALKTSNMTPLHYAVRYSSKKIIDLLLDSGASIFFAAKNEHEHPSKEETPFDWLTKYTNENLTEDDIVELSERLKLPSEEELKDLANKLNVSGEKFYANKEFKKANEEFKKAIELDKENIRALNNLALTSLKIDDKEHSLQASKRVIDSAESSTRQKASAYFNTGLACENAKVRGIYFNNHRYCKENSLHYYIQAYNTYPTKSRAKSVVKRFEKRDKVEFACAVNNADFERVYKRGEKFYFLHKKSMPNAIDTFPPRNKERTKKPLVLTWQSSVDLKNDYSVSVYKSKARVDDAFAFKQGECSNESEELVKFSVGTSDLTSKGLCCDYAGEEAP